MSSFTGTLRTGFTTHTTDNPLWLRCKKCGFDMKTTKHARKYLHLKCPKCGGLRFNNVTEEYQNE